MRGLPWRVLLVVFCAARSVSGHAEAEVYYPRSADVLVLEFSETPGGLKAPGSTLRIYGDGRFEVWRPDHEKGAGHWVGQLSTAEMDALCDSLVVRRVHAFDADVVRAAKRSGTRRRTWIATDPSLTNLVVHYRTSQSGGTGAGQTGSISWMGLRSDARDHPEIREIQDLNATIVELRALGRDSRLQPAP